MFRVVPVALLVLGLVNAGVAVITMKKERLQFVVAYHDGPIVCRSGRNVVLIVPSAPALFRLSRIFSSVAPPHFASLLFHLLSLLLIPHTPRPLLQILFFRLLKED